MLLTKYLRKSKALVGEYAEKAVRKISSRLRPGLSILMYHRVSNLATDPQQLAVTPENFEKQILFLQQTDQLLTVKRFDEIIETGGTFPPKSALLTFDDGYVDNYLEALPILERHGTQAIFFISTGHIDTGREFWWDDLERIFLESRKLPSKISFTFDGNGYEIITETRFDITKAYRKFHKIIKPLSAEKRELILAILCSWANLPRDGRNAYRSMNQQEIRQLSESSSAIIGAHSQNHVSLSSLPAEAQFKEMETSKKILENITGKPINHFSYPFGAKNDYNKESVAICKKLGFKASFSGFPGIARANRERFELPRLIVRNWNAEELAEHL